MKRVKRTSLFTVAVGFLCFSFISDSHVFAADENSCTKDIATFCNDVKSDQGALRNCLEQHEGQLSAPCKEYEAKMEKTRVESRERVFQQKKFREGCKNDIARFCKDAPPAQGGLVKCLNERQAELSAPCNEAMKAMEE